MSDYISALQAAVRERGVAEVAKEAYLREETVQAFLDDWGSADVATVGHLGYVCGLPIGRMHLTDLIMERCATCAEPPEAHYPLTPEDH